MANDEFGRLLAVAANRGRRNLYLAAVPAGMRRSELRNLLLGSVELDAGLLTIRDGKAKRDDVVPLDLELLAEFRAGWPEEARPTNRVVPTAVGNFTRQYGIGRAGIADVDDQGRVADLSTACASPPSARLPRAGIAPQDAQRILRHADHRTTPKHCTML